MNEYFIRIINFLKNHDWIIVLIGTTVISAIQFILTRIILERFKSKLQKSQTRFSLYNEMQIRSLSKVFTTLTNFKRVTIQIHGSRGSKSPEMYKLIASEWYKSYIKTKELLSNEKYILPKKIKNKYSCLMSNFSSLNEFVGKEKLLISLFYTDPFGEVELGGDYEDLIDIDKQLQKLDKKAVFDSAILSIDDLRSGIEQYFENIE